MSALSARDPPPARLLFFLLLRVVCAQGSPPPHLRKLKGGGGGGPAARFLSPFCYVVRLALVFAFPSRPRAGSPASSTSSPPRWIRGSGSAKRRKESPSRRPAEPEERRAPPADSGARPAPFRPRPARARPGARAPSRFRGFCPTPASRGCPSHGLSRTLAPEGPARVRKSLHIVGGLPEDSFGRREGEGGRGRGGGRTLTAVLRVARNLSQGASSVFLGSEKICR